MNNELLLEIRKLNKYFGETHANIDVDLQLHRGEIRGLIGENGSGKSTLISQIAGIYPHDSGEIIFKGERYNPQSHLEANAKGVAMVVQELGIISSLPACMNVFLGRTDKFVRHGVVDLKAMYVAAEKVFEEWGLPPVKLKKTLDGQNVETRKIVELARSLSAESDLLILDEITQSLSLNNRESLYEILKKYKQMDRSVLLVTHDIEEMIAITDTITVLRDGAVVGNLVSAETSVDEVRSMMVGREVSKEYYRSDMEVRYKDDVVLSVKNLTVKDEIENVSFELHKGEILGFCGLSDSGIHTVGAAVYGLVPNEGEVFLHSRNIPIKNAQTALANNMGYVPKDRDNEALMVKASIEENVCLPSTIELEDKLKMVWGAKTRKIAMEVAEQFSVKCTGISQTMDDLSGGNKQKINIGRWLVKDLDVLILDCPTRGVDVGVKAFIYSLMKEAKENNLSMILISDELTEVLGMSDRIIVMKDGQVNGEIRRDGEFTEHAVIGVMI